MAKYHGKDGVVQVGANAVANVTQFTLTVTTEVADASSMGTQWREHKVGLPGWSGSLTCQWDPDDTNGQVALAIGAEVDLSLLPEGSAAGAADYSGTATVTSISYSASMDAIVEASIDFQGNGALTTGVVPTP